jgi:hypothetical protein
VNGLVQFLGWSGLQAAHAEGREIKTDVADDLRWHPKLRSVRSRHWILMNWRCGCAGCGLIVGTNQHVQFVRSDYIRC